MIGNILKLGNGFGYIEPTATVSAEAASDSAESIRQIFFHVSALEGCEFKDLKVGDAVEFEIDEKSPAIGATRVRRTKL